MRAHLKVGEKWVVEELPADPEQILKWLWNHDGQQVVVADDENQTYYCARETELLLYQEKGKKAEMFIVLGKMLFDNMSTIQLTFSAVNEVFPDAVLESVTQLC